ncbi:hypothetical protein ACFE04_018963 [Oxalis oulophora]
MNKFLYSCLVLLSLCVTSFGQTCKTQTFTSNQVFTNCSDLSVLNSYLHWTYNQSAGTVDIAFRNTQTSTSRWTAWAINPNGPQMVGSQSLVALQNSSGQIHVYTTSLDSTSPSMDETDLSFPVSNLKGTFANSEMTIYATLHLPSNLLSTSQVWQEGPVSNGKPAAHATTGANGNSVGSIDFRSGASTSGGSKTTSKQKRKNTHGVISAVSWGILMPMGVIIARYMKVFKAANPAWFYLHIVCQSSAYVIGVAGWGLGLKLGKDSVGIEYTKHRSIGITLFVFGTLQVFALLLRPKPDHKYRLYWNIYHHALGYTTVILAIVNIFEGFNILSPDDKWKRAYVGILITLGVIAAVLEAVTWVIVIKRKKADSAKYDNGVNGANGVNGYGDRTHA